MLALYRNARSLAGVFFVCAVLHGCATIVPQAAILRDSWPRDLSLQAELQDAPFFPQTEYQCGPAALATTLVHFKIATSVGELVDRVYIPARKGSVQLEMLAAPRSFGVISYTLAPQLEAVLREIAAGTPVIVLQNLGPGPFTVWHYAVAVGYNARSGTVVLRSGEQRRLVLPLAAFEYTWKASGHWAMVTVPPIRMPATADRNRYFDAIRAVERAGQPRAAAIAYEKFVERWPEDLGAYVGLANAHYALGELHRAETALRRALEQFPHSAVALNNLAQTLSDQGRIEEALDLIDQATAAAGPHANAISETRAGILQRLKER
ncbi:MAG: PA2778 family cysteine peptidase [Burkholderiales bacterium]